MKYRIKNVFLFQTEDEPNTRKTPVPDIKRYGYSGGRIGLILNHESFTTYFNIFLFKLQNPMTRVRTLHRWLYCTKVSTFLFIDYKGLRVSAVNPIKEFQDE